MPSTRNAKNIAKTVAKSSVGNSNLNGEDVLLTGSEIGVLAEIIENKMIINLKKFLTEEENFDNFVKKISTEISNSVCTLLNNKLKEIASNATKMAENNKALMDKLSAVERKADDLEGYNRRVNLRFSGIVHEENENLEETIVKICAEKLKIDLKKEQIASVHRLPNKNVERPAVVIVRFTAFKYRDLIFRSKRNMKGSGVSIMEDLTNASYKLLCRCKETFGLKNTWTYNNLVKVKDHTGKIFSIKSNSDIDDIAKTLPTEENS